MDGRRDQGEGRAFGEDFRRKSNRAARLQQGQAAREADSIRQALKRERRSGSLPPIPCPWLLRAFTPSMPASRQVGKVDDSWLHLNHGPKTDYSHILLVRKA
jgi:hypothetical protein